MYTYNIYFQDPVTKAKELLESVKAADVLAAQLYAVKQYKTHPDWYRLKKQLVVKKASREEV